MKIRITLLTTVVSVALIYGVGLAQDNAPSATHEPEGHAHTEAACDVGTFVLQQQAYSGALAAFAQVFEADPDSALRTVYYAGLTYQTFALGCGFVPPEEDHDDDHAASEDEHSDEAHMALAMSIGDPASGQVLFTTLIPQTGFACSTCHRVDSAETLIGPGLINIADPTHDPAQHEHGGSAPEATETEHTERTMEEVVEYIHTSIVHPSDFVVPGFPDLLMPQIYEQLLNEQQINDLVAYLLTLPGN